MVHATEKIPMRKHHIAAIVATILLAFAVKVFFLTPVAEANVQGGGIDVSRMQENRSLPVQAVHDMTFVYSQED
jgi:hypothetical protein